MVWPSWLDSGSSTMRAMISVVLPGAKGTTVRMVLSFGHLEGLLIGPCERSWRSLSTERIAHVSTSQDCCAARFQSGLCRLRVIRDGSTMSATRPLCLRLRLLCCVAPFGRHVPATDVCGHSRAPQPHAE